MCAEYGQTPILFAKPFLKFRVGQPINGFLALLSGMGHEGDPRAETRNPKEGRKSEIRAVPRLETATSPSSSMPFREVRPQWCNEPKPLIAKRVSFGLRPSDFFRISSFGFRTWWAHQASSFPAIHTKARAPAPSETPLRFSLVAPGSGPHSLHNA